MTERTENGGVVDAAKFYTGLTRAIAAVALVVFALLQLSIQ